MSQDDKELLDLLLDAEEDVRNGRIAPIEESFAELRRMLEKSK